MCSNEANIMQTFNKIPGMALVSETIQGSFYISTIEQPNPGLNIMEIWKNIKDYEGFYQVSNIGNVKRIGRNILAKGTHTNGYYMVRLSKKGIKKCHLIHRLVAIAFIPNDKNKNEINHKNLIKKDNRIENLEWVTHKENIHHAIRNRMKWGKEPFVEIIDSKEHKICSKCKLSLPINKFYLVYHNNVDKYYRKSRCKRCLKKTLIYY